MKLKIPGDRPCPRCGNEPIVRVSDTETMQDHHYCEKCPYEVFLPHKNTVEA